MLALELGLFLPLVGFVLLMASSFFLRRKEASFLACLTMFISFSCFLSLLYEQSQGAEARLDVILFNWIPIAGLFTDFALHLDHLSLLMCLLVSGIGLIIHLYSIGYIDHEEDFGRYFALLNLFVFFMLLLVLASDLLLFFVGWEGVGLASYLLIGFWYQKPSAAKAAKKAFIVNRVGDLGLILGLLLSFKLFGTSNMEQICQQASVQFAIGAPMVTLVCLLYFWAAMGKSAQLPLHVWLADAMEGPTPVSALIHAATMVNAGVYLILRMHSLFMLSPFALQLISYVGIATAIFAALCAIRQTDLKRVLAYSTVSQLGLMFLGCGASAFYAAMFHLSMHAFVKALLFLSAGNVVHMLHGTTDMNKMGGLAKKLPITNILFLIGVLAMSGIPPLAIFLSKDLILEEIYLGDRKELYLEGLLVSSLTAFYLTRAYWLTFRSKAQVEHENVHEAPRIMWLPMTVLALLACVGGAFGFSVGHPGVLAGFLQTEGISFASEELSHGFHFSFQTCQSIAAALLGVGYSVWLYGFRKKRLESSLLFLKQAFYIDQLYENVFVNPLKALARWVSAFFEVQLEVATIQWPAQAGGRVACLLQRLQNGQIRAYVAWMVTGAAFLIIYFISRVPHA